MAESTEQFLCGDCQQTYATVLTVDLTDNSVERRCLACQCAFWTRIAVETAQLEQFTADTSTG